MPPVTYFHGTKSLCAARALISGEPLRRVQPGGVGRSRLASTQGDRVCLTADIGIAVDYATMVGRRDRPRFSDYHDEDGRGFVFAFRLAPGTAPSLEEDDLGNAVQIASQVVERGWHDGWHQPDWPKHPNRSFGAALARDRELMVALVAEARTRLTAAQQRLIDGPVSMGRIAQLGRCLAPKLSVGLTDRMVAAGANITLPSGLAVAHQGWQLPRTLYGKPILMKSFLAVAEPLTGVGQVDEMRPTRGETIRVAASDDVNVEVDAVLARAGAGWQVRGNDDKLYQVVGEIQRGLGWPHWHGTALILANQEGAEPAPAP